MQALLNTFNAMELDPIENVTCNLCKKGDNEASLLLCDGVGCKVAIHTGCINLPGVPMGNWYCPICKARGVPSERNVKKVFVYLRVSSMAQNDPKNGHAGLETQQEMILNFCRKRGIFVRTLFAEVGSARNPERLTQLGIACNQIRKGEAIIVYNVSRFSRNFDSGMDLLKKIHDRGGYVYSVVEDTDSFDERFLMLMMEAKKVSDNISKIVLDSHTRILQQGGFIGAMAPFGFTVTRNEHGLRVLVRNELEQKTVAIILEAFRNNDELKKIADKLNEECSCRGKPWTKNKILNVVNNNNNNNNNNN